VRLDVGESETSKLRQTKMAGRRSPSSSTMLQDFHIFAVRPAETSLLLGQRFVWVLIVRHPNETSALETIAANSPSWAPEIRC
jgi:hypothetical protein